MTAAPRLRSRQEEIFPALTERQSERVAALGHRRAVRAGDVLFDTGSTELSFFLVSRGEIEIHRPTAGGEILVATHGPGQFTGEIGLIAGRGSVVRARVAADGEVIELPRDRLQQLVQSDGELSEILMRAFILRRLELVSQGLGDVVVGSQYCSATLRVKEFLKRNGHPFVYLDLDTDPTVQELLDSFHVTEHEIPVMIVRGQVALKNPSNAAIADSLGFNAALDEAQVRDLVVIGAGPAGLAAAVYGASEGLDVLVVEAGSPGGQAGTSSKIENYLGFPTGISGEDLAGRAYHQSQKFGAQLLVARGALSLRCERRPYRVELSDGRLIGARTVIVATGANYRRPDLEALIRFEGAGVYYAATAMEASLCSATDEVVVVGGANSAGQAAVFLAGRVRKVHMLIRGAGLRSTMSRYLIRRIEEHPAIELHTHSELVAADGEYHLESVQWKQTREDRITAKPIRHVFMMTGADPCTAWLNNCLALDRKGFIVTGADLSAEQLAAAQWPLARPPHLLETSLPGVFAVGDVRSGNIKRVASAVGEGSICVSFVHRVLSE